MTGVIVLIECLQLSKLYKLLCFVCCLCVCVCYIYCNVYSWYTSQIITEYVGRLDLLPVRYRRTQDYNQIPAIQRYR
jgi:hypothetical protein